MKFKKIIAGLTAVVAFFALIPVKSSKAATLNSIARQYSYVGTTYLDKMLATEHVKYNNFYEQNPIIYRNKKPEGIVIHETADPGATAHDEAIYFNREWMNMYAYVHAFVDHQQVIQMMTTKYGVWGAGPIANARFIQVELCEETSRNNFAKSINNDAIWCAQMLHKWHLTPSNATHTGKGTIWSHAAVTKFLGGTTHGDPVGYFDKWGYSMDQFYELIKYYYNLQAAKPVKQKVTVKKKTTSKKTTKTSAIKVPKAKAGEKIIMHDSQVYNYKGRSVKGRALKYAGTIVNNLGTKIINKRKYYHIGVNQYIIASNIDGTFRKLKQNAYIYDTVGTSDGKTQLIKGSQIRTYGGIVKIWGVKYYAVSPTQFVKAENF